MIYRIKVYTGKKPFSAVTIKCGDEYLKGVKTDLQDEKISFLDLENIIIPKSGIRSIVVKKISEN